MRDAYGPGEAGQDFERFLVRAMKEESGLAGIPAAKIKAVISATLRVIDGQVSSGTTVDELAFGAECESCGIWFVPNRASDDDSPSYDDGEDNAAADGEDHTHLCENCDG